MSQITNALTKELVEYFEIRFYPLVRDILENRIFTKSEYYQANPVGSNYSGSLDFAQGASTEFIERMKLYLSKVIRLIQVIFRSFISYHIISYHVMSCHVICDFYSRRDGSSAIKTLCCFISSTSWSSIGKTTFTVNLLRWYVDR